MLTPENVKKQVKASLKTVPIGKSPAEVQNGLDFYKHMFTHHRHLRHYFKGAEAYTAEDIQKSERFTDQGRRLLLAIYLLADTFDDEQTFRAYVREVVNRHRDFQMDPVVWSDFFTVFVEFLEFREVLTDEQKVAWNQLSKVFNEECQSHLKELGLPHV